LLKILNNGEDHYFICFFLMGKSCFLYWDFNLFLFYRNHFFHVIIGMKLLKIIENRNFNFESEFFNNKLRYINKTLRTTICVQTSVNWYTEKSSSTILVSLKKDLCSIIHRSRSDGVSFANHRHVFSSVRIKVVVDVVSV